MCEGIHCSIDGSETRVFFTEAGARLPVLCRDGRLAALPWGRRRRQAGALPLGGWARLDAIHAGRWDRWFPVPVKIVARAFMERDIEGRAQWFELSRGKVIQGLVARDGHERRVYVVTVTPEMADAVHGRWPRIVTRCAAVRSGGRAPRGGRRPSR